MPSDTKQPKLDKDSNIIAAISYILGIIVAIVIYLIKKDDKFVRFHALQTMLLDVVLMILFFIFWIVMVAAMFGSFASGSSPGFFIFYPVIFIIAGLIFLLRLYLMYKAYKQEWFKLPVIGNYAEKFAS